MLHGPLTRIEEAHLLSYFSTSKLEWICGNYLFIIVLVYISDWQRVVADSNVMIWEGPLSVSVWSLASSKTSVLPACNLRLVNISTMFCVCQQESIFNLQNDRLWTLYCVNAINCWWRVGPSVCIYQVLWISVVHYSQTKPMKQISTWDFLEGIWYSPIS